MYPQVQHVGSAKAAAVPGLSEAGNARSLPGRRVGLLLLGILAVGAWIRFAYASGRELWLDETHSAFLASLPLRELIAFVKGDVHPPLYFLLLAGWTRLLGDDPGTLRLLSALCSLLAAVAVYFGVARLLRSRSAGLLAAVLLLLSPVFLQYSVEVRMYALAALAIGLALAWLPHPSYSSPR